MPETKTEQNQADVVKNQHQDKIPFTECYKDNKYCSRIIGWSLAGALCVAVLIGYMIYRSFWSMTYHQQKFRSKCQRMMKEAHVEALKAAFHNGITNPEMSNFLKEGVPQHEATENPENVWINSHKDFMSKNSELTLAILKKYLENMKGGNENPSPGEALPSTSRSSLEVDETRT